MISMLTHGVHAILMLVKHTYMKKFSEKKSQTELFIIDDFVAMISTCFFMIAVPKVTTQSRNDTQEINHEVNQNRVKTES